MFSITVPTRQKARLDKIVLTLADGRTFDLGRPGTRRYDRRLRKYVQIRLKSEPAFFEAFGDRYDKKGRLL
jgi:hypothetical protein